MIINDEVNEKQPTAKYSSPNPLCDVEGMRVVARKTAENVRFP